MQNGGKRLDFLLGNTLADFQFSLMAALGMDSDPALWERHGFDAFIVSVEKEIATPGFGRAEREDIIDYQRFSLRKSVMHLPPLG